MTTAVAKHDDSVERLLRDLRATHTKPLWAEMTRLNPPLPNPKSIPHLWEYDQIRPHLLRAGEMVKESQAERRVLLLVNPKMGILLSPCSKQRN